MWVKKFPVIKTSWILGLIIILGALLRWYRLTDSMSFFYDQGRDALMAAQLLRGKFVLIGPSADTTGLFMGPLWYYLLAVLYGLTGGNPVPVTVILSLLDLATILLLYTLGREFLGKTAGLIAGGIWAVGPVAVAYSRTLANPSTTAFWTVLLILGLVWLERGKAAAIVLVAACQSVIFQLNAAGGFLLFLFTVLALWKERKNVNGCGWWAIGAGIVLLSFSPQILFELRHSWRSLDLVHDLFFRSSPAEGYIHGLWLRAENWKAELANYSFYLEPGISLASLIFGLCLVIGKLRHRGLFLLWLIVPVLVFLFFYPRGESHPHYLLSWVPAAVLVLGMAASVLGRKFILLTVFILLVWGYFGSVGLNREILIKDHIAQPADPNRVGLGDQLRVLDRIYQDARGEPFGYYSYNITPYWADENWQYLFSWYGRKHWGYLPAHRSGNPLYLITEPDPFLPAFTARWYRDFQSPDKGPVVMTFAIGSYRVDKFDKGQIQP